MKLTVGILLAVAVLIGPVAAQYYFGQNKVHYADFDWHVLKTAHFDIYFYPEEEQIAHAGAKLAEDAYSYLVEKFNHVVDKRIPLIIYSHPSFFSQTNVIPDVLPENVAGFTEFFKERVVIPFDGSYQDFEHVIRHELVHVFMMEKIGYVSRSHGRRNPAMPPLWFTEGMAEYWSAGWDATAEMTIRDMVLSARIISLERLGAISGTFLMYKVGQSFCRYLAETYGDDRLTLLFDNWWKEPTFAQLVEITFGTTLSALGQEWEYYLKKNYFPVLSDRDLPSRISRQLTRRSYNVKPAIYAQQAESTTQQFVVFKTIRLGYSNIALMPIAGEGAGFKRLVKGERSARFESLHFVDSGIDVDPSGRLVFASKSGHSDMLYVYDIRFAKIVLERRFDQLTAISSPSWSHDGRRIVFSGAGKDGHADLYIYDLEGDTVLRLTEDLYLDGWPTFSADDQHVVFSSDRHGMRGSNVFVLDLVDGQIRQLTFGEDNNVSPKWATARDTLIFVADREGVPNIYLMEHPLSEAPRLYQLTDLATGAFDPVFAPGDTVIVYSAYEGTSYHIFELKLDSCLAKQEMTAAGMWDLSSGWQPPQATGESVASKMKYKAKLSFDIAQSALAHDAIFGTMGGLQGALTDMLGDHQLYFLLYNTNSTRVDFIKGFNAATSYINRQRRFNWGMGLYRFYNEYDDDYYGYVSEETYGGVLVGSYPFSRYDRIESSLYIRRYFKDTPLANDPDATLATPVLSYVKDTSIWETAGPIDGFRLHITVAASLDLAAAKYYNSLLNIDMRKYFRLAEYSGYAVRGVLLTSTGEDPRRYYLGGSWDLRGYPRRSFYDRHILLLNNELRFPLVDRLYVGFPIGALNFQAIRGALFVDAARAWGDKPARTVGSFGFGVRVALGNVTVLRFDFSKRADRKDVYGHGMDFDFFFGWNY